MVTIQATDDGLSVEIQVFGIAAYLDTWALILLATGEPDRREKFLHSLAKGGSLLFSGANILELRRPEGEVASFLDAIGPNWAPIELDPNVVVTREDAGHDPRTACLMEDFITAFVADRIRELESGGGVIDLSAETV